MRFFGLSFFSVFLFLSFSCNTPTQKASESVSETSLPAPSAKTKMKCLFFFIADCPASKACMKGIMELQEKYGPNGLEITGILSDPDVDEAVLTEVTEHYGLDIEIQRDSTLEIARKHNAQVTPQFLLYNQEEELVYDGLMDNYYYSFGKHRKVITKKYLEDAILATLEGKYPEVSKTKPIGCRINFDEISDLRNFYSKKE